MTSVKYPAIDDPIAINKTVLVEVKAKSADRHEVISKERLKNILEQVKN